MNAPTPRPARPKLWTRLAVGTAIGLATVPALAETVLNSPEASPERLWLASGEGGEGGEGGAAVTDSEGAALSMVAQLGLMEGALRTGAELAKSGNIAMAAAIVRDLDEVRYKPLAPEFEKYKAPAFEDALKAAVLSITKGRPSAEVQTTTDSALAGIKAARAADLDPREWFDAIIFLTRKAGEEYGKGVSAGAMVDAGEYRESWGNVQAARALAADLALVPDEKVKSAAEAAITVLDEVNTAFGGIDGSDILSGDESLFAAAAAKVELESFKVK